MSALLRHEFLTLSLLCAIPALVIFVARRDLRPMIRRMALASLPFALTERFFYPDYWSPRFLFDLIDVLGFGLEDVLFVTTLAAFTSTSYAFVAKKRYVPIDPCTTGQVSTSADPSAAPPNALLRGAGMISLALGLALLLLWLTIPMIFATLVSMAVLSAGMLAGRRDLVVPGLAGGTLAVVVYGLACVALDALDPGVFERIWHTDALWNRFVLGVPLEELAYGWLAGLAATIFHPWVFRERLVPL
ncbi:lycopene cyclase domain-containing protein [Myxococcota bacterium]|nr:lycopene cyclase domain-containing protein [Myxococcota bacterium]